MKTIKIIPLIVSILLTGCIQGQQTADITPVKGMNTTRTESTIETQLTIPTGPAPSIDTTRSTPPLEGNAITPLPETGPYLAVIDLLSPRILFYGPDGEGPLIVQNPPQCNNCFELPSISPNGKFVAYYSGTFYEPPYDWSLNIIQTSDSTIIKTIRLLSNDFPSNFMKEAEVLTKNPPKEFVGWEVNEIADALRDAFYSGIYTFAWSPDSSRIAFAGEMDGPSSDVYAYDVATEAMLRLTDGPTEIGFHITWSPDGRWIVHQGVYIFGEGSSVQNFIVDRDGKFGAKAAVSSYPELTGVVFMNWISDYQLLVCEGATGLAAPQILDIRDAKMHLIFQRHFDGIVFDKDNHHAYISTNTDYDYKNEKEIPAGIYLVDVARDETRFLMEKLESLAFLGWEDTHSFAGLSDSGTVVFFNETGKTISLSEEGWEHLVPSPDRSKFITDGPGGLKMYSMDQDRLSERMIVTGSVEQWEWRPDGKAITYESNDTVILVELDGKKTPIVDLPDDSWWQWIS
jgi:WD40 repeat protein